MYEHWLFYTFSIVVHIHLNGLGVCVETLNTTCHVDVVDEEAASISQNTDIGTIMLPCVCVCV